MATVRNLAWVGLAGTVLLGLGAFMIFGGSGKPHNGRPSSRNHPQPGEAKPVQAKPAKPTVPVEERWIAGPAIERPDAPEGAPNVVLVVLTAARKDQLSPYGAAAGVTPFLSRVAARGARFLDTIADSPYTRASSAAMLTGRHSWNLGLVEPGPEASQRKLAADDLLLSERLRAAGWWTAGVTGNFNLNVDGPDGVDHGGIGRGFDTHLNAQDAGFAAGRRQEASFVVQQAIAAIEGRDASRPFYLQLDLIDTHAPIRVVKDQLADFEPDRPNAPYRAALNRVDRKLEELHTTLAEQGLMENTYLVVVADHGEGLEAPPHHGKFHGRLLYESSVAVPWVVEGPGIAPNLLVGGLAAGVDLAPTLLDLVGLPIPEGLDGMSHAAVLRGEGARTQREEAWSATWQFTAKRASWWTTARQCQVDFGSTDVEDSFVDACYDRRTDPAFTRVVDDPAAMTALKAWVEGVQALVEAP